MCGVPWSVVAQEGTAKKFECLGHGREGQD